MDFHTRDSSVPDWHRYLGLGLSLFSGLLIGSSFIIKKLALLEVERQDEEKLGTGHGYLTNWKWWVGLLTMALGEAANFVAFSFAPAVMITPLGAVSVVVAAILSSYVLKETLSFSGKIGCFQCIVGATILVLFAPHDGNLTQTVQQFWSYASTPLFITYFVCMVLLCIFLIVYCVPRYAQKNVLLYISLCSIGGSFLVLCTQGFGSALVYSIGDWQDQQITSVGFWILGLGVVLGCIWQIHWLNAALANFNTAVVTPVYYVMFTTMTMISSCFLFGKFATSGGVEEILATLLGVAVIASGVALLYDFNRDLLRAEMEVEEVIVEESPTTAVEESPSELTLGGEKEIGKSSTQISIPMIPIISEPSQTSLAPVQRRRVTIVEDRMRPRTATTSLPVPGLFGSFRLPTPMHEQPDVSRQSSNASFGGTDSIGRSESRQDGLTQPVSRGTSRQGSMIAIPSQAQLSRESSQVELNKSGSVVIHDFGK